MSQKNPRYFCWFEQVRAISTCGDSSNLQCSNLVADRFEAGRRQVRRWSQICSKLEFGLSSSSLAASWHELASLRPASDLSATR